MKMKASALSPHARAAERQAQLAYKWLLFGQVVQPIIGAVLTFE